MIKTFDGSGDVTVWLQKVKLVAELRKLTQLEALIPLYLEGAAFSVYNELSEDDKKVAAKIEECLLRAFAQSMFSAFDTLRSRSWKAGEAVDVYLADLRRLAGLAGIHDEAFIRCSFVCGLPLDVSVQLRAAAQIGTMTLAAIADQARVLVAELGREQVHSALAAVKVGDQRMMAGRDRTDGEGRRSGRQFFCYNCGGDHTTRFCSHPRKMTCWNCNKDGHISRDCPEKKASGNDNRRSHAPTLSKDK